MPTPPSPSTPPRKPAPEALFRAIEDGDYTGVRRLVDQGADVDARDNAGNSPLIRAASFGYADIVRYLLDHNAQVDARNDRGDTALITACSSYGTSRDSVVRLLLEKGANIEAKNNFGTTALAAATERNRTTIVTLLKNETTKRKRLADEFARAAEEKRRAETANRQETLREKAKRVPKLGPPKPPKAA